MWIDTYGRRCIRCSQFTRQRFSLSRCGMASGAATATGDYSAPRRRPRPRINMPTAPCSWCAQNPSFSLQRSSSPGSCGPPALPPPPERAFDLLTLLRCQAGAKRQESWVLHERGWDKPLCTGCGRSRASRGDHSRGELRSGGRYRPGRVCGSGGGQMAGEGAWAGLDQTPDRGCPKARCKGLHRSSALRKSPNAQPAEGPRTAREVALRGWHRARRDRSLALADCTRRSSGGR